MILRLEDPPFLLVDPVDLDSHTLRGSYSLCHLDNCFSYDCEVACPLSTEVAFKRLLNMNFLSCSHFMVRTSKILLLVEKTLL